jgi:uncharacterized membrane protein SirB2
MMILLLKYLHVTCVVLSISGFLVRGVWMMQSRRGCKNGCAWRRISSIRFCSIGDSAGDADPAISVRAGWLTAKVLALIASYRHRRDRPQIRKHQKIRVSVWLVAIAIFVHRPGRTHHQVLPFVA